VEWTWHCTERRRSNLIAPGARHALMPAVQRPRASPKAHAHHLRLLHTPAHPGSARKPRHAGRPCRARCGRRARGPFHVLMGTRGAEKRAPMFWAAHPGRSRPARAATAGTRPPPRSAAARARRAARRRCARPGRAPTAAATAAQAIDPAAAGAAPAPAAAPSASQPCERREAASY
jgi:hypothetical protein